MQLNRSNVQAYKLETERHTTPSNKLKKIDMQVHNTSKSCNRMQLQGTNQRGNLSYVSQTMSRFQTNRDLCQAVKSPSQSGTSCI